MDIPYLTDGEARVYQALVAIGESSVGHIIKKSRVSHSKVYDILERLNHKGLVSSIQMEGKQLFRAAHPKQLQSMIKEEKAKIKSAENELSEVIPQLELMRQSTPSHMLTSYEGMKGLITTITEALESTKKGETIYVLGSPRKLIEQVGGHIIDWQKRRIQKGIICKLITNQDSPKWKYDWWEKSKKDKMTLTRRSPHIAPCYIIITPQSVSTLYISSTIFSFTVHQKEVAASYLPYFDLLWKSSS